MQRNDKPFLFEFGSATLCTHESSRDKCQRLVWRIRNVYAEVVWLALPQYTLQKPVTDVVKRTELKAFFPIREIEILTDGKSALS